MPLELAGCQRQLINLMGFQRLNSLRPIVDNAKNDTTNERGRSSVLVPAMEYDFFTRASNKPIWPVANRLVTWHRAQLLEELTDFERRLNLMHLSSALMIAKEWDTARGVFEEFARTDREGEGRKLLDDDTYLGTRGCLAALLGDRSTALRSSEELSELESGVAGYIPYYRAEIASCLGQREDAVNFLKEAFSQGYHDYIELHLDVFLEPLWDYQPYRELLLEMRLPVSGRQDGH